SRSSEQNVLDEAFPDQVGAVEIHADDDAGDEDDDDALDQLALAGPLDLLQLAPRLGDEVLEPPAGDRAGFAGRFGLSTCAPGPQHGSSQPLVFRPTPMRALPASAENVGREIITARSRHGSATAEPDFAPLIAAGGLEPPTSAL